MSFNGILERLKSIPPEKQQLSTGNFWVEKDGCGCALGAAFPSLRSRRAFRGMTFMDVYQEIQWRGLADLVLQESGLTLEEAETIEATNDAFLGTPEPRYAHMVEWLSARVAEPVFTE